MAWKMNVGGIELDATIPDMMVTFIKEQLQELGDPAKGMWLQIGDQDAEGSLQIYLTPSTPILLTRSPNDPSELLYKEVRGTDSVD
ncbi:hypothetical protein [Microbacterium sp.]|uniref:hypothetical protein n=1 Tax=Microbacterium sp. TaxID=51671 RepID=UPI002622FF8A|nr:hypothetical protein [Microbacterium sp.]MCV0334079.1 hypothetical protein [Microbacterium sp.]MCV0374393.1 hypothetical protein [Microbacterium sp.]MCV0389465.1 hypothetical protein [Microbacterium sp.]MCV0418999.1 hypothetical protein [Microbacterium sp.]MCV0421305.1 hypothetical protein [Microbacterium sp.]